jgi:hypothetical protein
VEAVEAPAQRVVADARRSGIPVRRRTRHDRSRGRGRAGRATWMEPTRGVVEDDRDHERADERKRRLRRVLRRAIRMAPCRFSR